MYPIGTLKVAWVEKNPEYLSSDMFGPTQLTEAIALGEKKGDYMIMQLVSQSKDYYRWKLMPYGNYKQYLRSMKFRRKLEDLFSSKEKNEESGFNVNSDVDLKLVNVTDEKQTQIVRIVDVLLIGPVLIYASTFKSLPKYLRYFLLITGIATILYNGNNYLKNRPK